MRSSWRTLKSILRRQVRTTNILERKGVCTLHMRTASQSNTELKAVYDALSVDSVPLAMQKTII